MGGIAHAEVQLRRFLESGRRAIDPRVATTTFAGAASCHVAIEYGFTGPNTTNAMSCAAGTIAIGEAGRRAGEAALAQELIEPFARPPRRERGARRADLHHLHALLRLANDDLRGAKAALRAGLRALEDQYALMVSVELQAGVAARGEALAKLGTELALEGGRAGDVLRWADRWRGQAIQAPASG